MTEEPQVLISPRLTLEPFRESDITPAYLGWLRDPEVLQYSNQRFREHTHSSCLAYLNSFKGTDNLFLRIVHQATTKMIGTMTAYIATPHGVADMGILVGEREIWGQGLGLEAWETLMNYLLNEKKLRKVTAGTLNCNLGMLRIMERSGMVLEGVRTKQEIVAGEPQDMLYFAKFQHV